MTEFVYRPINFNRADIPAWLDDSWVVDFRQYFRKKRKKAKRIARIHSSLKEMYVPNPYKNTTFRRFTKS